MRKYRSDSIGAIKSEIESNEFIFVCDFTDTLGLAKMLICFDELSANGCTLFIQEQDRVISREILNNLLQMHAEIHEETLAAIDAEVGEDEDGEL